MIKKIAITAAAVLMAVIIFAGGFILGFNFTRAGSIFSELTGKNTLSSSSNNTNQADAAARESRNTAIRSISETIDHVLASAINKKTLQELVSAAIEGMLGSLDDKYADYFSPEDYSKIMDSYSGTMSGIGVVVTADENGQVVIVNVIENTPASEKGLKEKDIITAVNGTSTKDIALDQVVAMIKGKEGTEVIITVFRPSENKNIDYTIKRQRFYVPNFFVKTLKDNILYIQYIDFQNNGSAKLEEKLKDVINDDTSGIILDLRNNLGGTLDDAVGLCDIFLDGGTIVTVRGRSNNKDSFEEFKAKSGIYTSLPMAVLINSYSASAAELAAGAFRDLGRAILIGEKSFGKGTVQVLNELPDGSGIKFTTAKYYLPSGATIDGTGIEPDIKVVASPEDTDDLQLNRAVEELKKQVSRKSR
ncbi:MAG: putative CtpA-like serine protease [Actinobacteria bacterium ADurb.Bin346]|nr:MAG: putative CtpA-like serine protease [Actinobacteria bacterium ADurb.Bin346]